MIERREKILEFIVSNKKITSNNWKDILRVTKATVERDLSKLREENGLEYKGSLKNGYWIVKGKWSDIILV